MSITAETVLRVARLARLELTSDEVSAMQQDLDRILDYVDQLALVSVQGVEPRTCVAVHQAPLRRDEPEIGLSPEVAQAEAMRQSEGGFAVPGFVRE